MAPQVDVGVLVVRHSVSIVRVFALALAVGFGIKVGLRGGEILFEKLDEESTKEPTNNGC